MSTDLENMFQKAQTLTKELQEKQEQLAKERFEVEVGGGLLKMVYNGKGEALKIDIDPQILTPKDAELLGDLILSAFRQGQKESQEKAKKLLIQDSNMASFFSPA